jgi:hypothetical protein
MASSSGRCPASVQPTASLPLPAAAKKLGDALRKQPSDVALMDGNFREAERARNDPEQLVAQWPEARTALPIAAP